MASGRQPTGTVTFLITDIQGSTELWDAHPAEMRTALERHDEIVRAVVDRHDGYVFSTGGDAFCIAFSRTTDALLSAVEAQRELGEERWPEHVGVRVRMGIHTGEAHERDGDYFGSAVSRAARVMSLAGGGQIVCSDVSAQLLRSNLSEGLTLVAMGERRLRGFAEPERVFALEGDGLASIAPLDGRQHAGTMPLARTRLIGRTDECAEVAALLTASPLVTLVGAGGVGKTSVATHVGADVADRYPDGVRWLELAPVRDGADVVHAAAAALGVRQQGSQPLLETICEAIGRRRLLLVVDNCEHVAVAVAQIVSAIGQRCSETTVLATSRERLGVPGERQFTIRPLPAGSADDPAMELLLERLDRSVVSDESERAALLDICRAVDGLPLALELAAARCNALGPSDVATRLQSRLRMLTDNRRSEGRQKTLRATIEWSYELLDDRERLVFERLAVFTGGFTLDAAEAVCGGHELDTTDIADAVTALVEKSLVEHRRRRYHMLETTREFAAELLHARSDEVARRNDHLAFFIAFVRRVRLGLRSRDEGRWHQALGGDWANVRAAFRHAMDQDDVDAATTIVANLALESVLRRPEGAAWAREAAARFCDRDGPLRHELLGAASLAEWALGNLQLGIELGNAALAAHPAPETATDRLAEEGACINLMWVGRLEESAAISTAVVSDAHAKGDTWDEMMFLTYLAYATGAQGRADEALQHAERARQLAAGLGAPTARAWTGLVLARLLNDSRAALHHVEAALDLARSVDDGWLMSQLVLERARRMSRVGRPQAALEEVLACAVHLHRQGRFLHVWRALIIAAEVQLALGNLELSTLLIGASRISPAAATHVADIAEIESVLTTTLGRERVTDLLARGATLTLADAVKHLVDPYSPGTTVPPGD